MLKAIVSYSKKIPVPDSEYSSQGYSLSLETEIPETDPRAIQAKLHETFELVKSSVEQEMAKGNGNGHAAKPPETQQGQKAGTEVKASNKQIKFITDLATQRNIEISDLNATIRKTYGVAGLYDLNRKQASDLLNELNKQRAA